jgi:hypothetical protein
VTIGATKEENEESTKEEWYYSCDYDPTFFVSLYNYF